MSILNAVNQPRQRLGVSAPQTTPLYVQRPAPQELGQQNPGETPSIQGGWGHYSLERTPTYNPQQTSYAHQAPQVAGYYDQQQPNQLGITYWNLHNLARNIGLHNGAAPPHMVNVPWSNQQVPYGTPMPRWYEDQMYRQAQKDGARTVNMNMR